MNLDRHRKLKISLLVLLGVIFLFGALSLLHPFRRGVRITAQTAIAHLSPTPNTPFPAIDTTKLTPLQQEMVNLNRQEYVRKPVTYDMAVLKYTAGSKEPWCADYISWLYKQAGKPLNNPNSGSWRIPGVYTLQEYFQSVHRYKRAGNYMPKTGDVAIFSTGEGHTAMVLSVHGDTMTTIGGNVNGHLHLDTVSLGSGRQTDLLGFGVLQ